jgi:hypothetical protein
LKIPKRYTEAVKMYKMISGHALYQDFLIRRVWRYQRGNKNQYIEEGQTTQWPKEKVQKDKQRSTKHTHKLHKHYLSNWRNHKLIELKMVNVSSPSFIVSTNWKAFYCFYVTIFQIRYFLKKKNYFVENKHTKKLTPFREFTTVKIF